MSTAILKSLFGYKYRANAELLALLATLPPERYVAGLAAPRDLYTKFLHQSEPARRQD
jgi:hypothetical protein